MAGNLQGLFNDMRSLAIEQRRLRKVIKQRGFQYARQEKSKYDKNRRVLRIYNLAFVIAKKGKNLFDVERDARPTIYGNPVPEDANKQAEPICELCAEVCALLEQYGFTVPKRTENGRTVYDWTTCSQL